MSMGRAARVTASGLGTLAQYMSVSVMTSVQAAGDQNPHNATTVLRMLRGTYTDAVTVIIGGMEMIVRYI
jgi:hypothetical protein